MDEDDGNSSPDDDNGGLTEDRHGIWMRRRRLDGALNRVPVGFYSKVWMILENCRAITIRGRTLDTFLTQGVSIVIADMSVQRNSFRLQIKADLTDVLMSMRQDALVSTPSVH